MARCFFAAGRSASFARRPRRSARTAASSGFKTLHVAAQFAFGFCLEFKHEIAVHVGIQHFRMHVAFAADGRRIAELARHLFDGGAEVALRLRGAVEAFKLIERHRRQDRARPGAEILRGDILAGDFLEIVVHVG